MDLENKLKQKANYMFKALIVAAIAVVGVSAEISKFPSFDAFHANCAIQVTYTAQQCSAVYSSMKNALTQFQGGDAGKGVYAFVDQKEDTYFWMTRTTPVKKYVDDIAFELSQSGINCVVKSRSRSQSLSYYDYSTNFCNMWNPLKNTGAFTNQQVTSCPFPAADPATTCNTY